MYPQIRHHLQLLSFWFPWIDLDLVQAYLQGSSNDDYKEIVAKIQAVLFLSTPHRGTNLAEVLNRILTVSIVNSPKHYVAELNRNSAAIEDLNEVFRNIAPKLQLFSFYETLQTSVGPKSMVRTFRHHKTSIRSRAYFKQMVLEKDSSILGYPGEVSQPLNGNHHDVCKFASQQDSNYKSVRSVIQTLVSYHRQAGMYYLLQSFQRLPMTKFLTCRSAD